MEGDVQLAGMTDLCDELDDTMATCTKEHSCLLEDSDTTFGARVSSLPPLCAFCAVLCILVGGVDSGAHRAGASLDLVLVPIDFCRRYQVRAREFALVRVAGTFYALERIVTIHSVEAGGYKGSFVGLLSTSRIHIIENTKLHEERKEIARLPCCRRADSQTSGASQGNPSRAPGSWRCGHDEEYLDKHQTLPRTDRADVVHMSPGETCQ